MLFRNWKKIRCPGGRIVQVYRIDDAFPILAAPVNAALNSTFDAAEQLTATFNGHASRDIKEVGTRLDKVNHSLRERFRAAYIVYHSDPCSNNEYLMREVRRINQQEERLREFAIALEHLVYLASQGSADTEVIPLLRDVLTQYVPTPPGAIGTPNMIQQRNEAWYERLSE